MTFEEIVCYYVLKTATTLQVIYVYLIRKICIFISQNLSMHIAHELLWFMYKFKYVYLAFAYNKPEGIDLTRFLE